VLYEDSMIHKIFTQLETDHLKIPLVTRSQIIDDYFALANSRT